MSMVYSYFCLPNFHTRVLSSKFRIRECKD